MTALPSLHDNFLVSYEVNCETRQIKLYAKRDPRLPAVNEQQTTRAIIFKGVEGYQFENDAFGNMIFSLGVLITSKPMPSTGKTGHPAFPRLPPNRTCGRHAKIDANDPERTSVGRLLLHEALFSHAADAISVLVGEN
jgi:hypothetical protein